MATPSRRGDLWFISKSGLFHSTDAGHSFNTIGGEVTVEAIGFGKAAPQHDYPTVFAIGTMNSRKAIWRSIDGAQCWQRVNDDEHQYGTRFRCIAGDPRIFGRVYVGTDGRGIVYGEPVTMRR